MATEGDWASYRAAVVDMAPPDVEPFRIAPADPGLYGRWPFSSRSPIHIVTAWNPDSVRLDHAANRARHRRLVTDLGAKGARYWPATGRDLDDGHVEEGVAVADLTEREAVALGHRHGQAAIYGWTPDAWLVISCTDGRRHVSGWRIEPPAPPT